MTFTNDQRAKGGRKAAARARANGTRLSLKPDPTANARRNQAAFKEMSLCERETGMTADQLRERQQEMKRAALARLGLDVKAPASVADPGHDSPNDRACVQ